MSSGLNELSRLTKIRNIERVLKWFRFRSGYFLHVRSGSGSGPVIFYKLDPVPVPVRLFFTS